jgi:hypothetical protein
MKKLNQFFLFLSCAILLWSCTEDTAIVPANTPPSIFFNAGTGDDQTVTPGQEITTTISVTPGSEDLNALEVLEDGAKIDVFRITFRGGPVGGNPILITGTDTKGFTTELKIKASTGAGTKSIEVVAIDKVNKKTSAIKKVTTNATPPTSKYNGPAVVDNLVPNAINNFSFDVTKGSGNISTIEVKENGVAIDKARLDITGIAFTKNPEIMPVALQQGFTAKSIGVKSNSTPGTYEYTFIFTDIYGLKTEQKVSAKVGQPTTFMKLGVLFNSAGPTGNGGLDLDQGLGTGSASALAEIKDLGNESGTVVWQQKITSVSPTELKQIIKPTQVPDNFALSSITFVSQISSLHSAGTLVGSASAKIKKGDVFTAKRDDKYYIFEVADVTVTSNDNLDNYSINIKW